MSCRGPHRKSIGSVRSHSSQHGLGSPFHQLFRSDVGLLRQGYVSTLLGDRSTRQTLGDLKWYARSESVNEIYEKTKLEFRVEVGKSTHKEDGN